MYLLTFSGDRFYVLVQYIFIFLNSSTVPHKDAPMHSGKFSLSRHWPPITLLTIHTDYGHNLDCFVFFFLLTKQKYLHFLEGVTAGI